MDNVIVEYSWKDVQIERPNLSEEQCKELLDVIFNDLEEALLTAGNNALELLVSLNEENED
jgi:hypothetical protein